MNDFPFCLLTKSNTVLNRSLGNSSYVNDPRANSSEWIKNHSCQGCNLRPAICAASIASNPSEVSGVSSRKGRVHSLGVVLPSRFLLLPAARLEFVNSITLRRNLRSKGPASSRSQAKSLTIFQKSWKRSIIIRRNLRTRLSFRRILKSPLNNHVPRINLPSQRQHRSDRTSISTITINMLRSFNSHLSGLKNRHGTSFGTITHAPAHNPRSKLRGERRATRRTCPGCFVFCGCYAPTPALSEPVSGWCSEGVHVGVFFVGAFAVTASVTVSKVCWVFGELWVC